MRRFPLKHPFRTTKGTFWWAVASVFMEKTMFLFFLHNKKPVFYVVFGGEKRPQSIFLVPQRHVFLGFSKLSLPSAENREEPRIMASVDRKTRFFFISPLKLDQCIGYNRTSGRLAPFAAFTRPLKAL